VSVFEKPANVVPDSLAAPAAAGAVGRRIGVSRRQLVWRRFLRSRAAVAGGLVVVAFYLIALCANFLAPYGVDQRFIEYLYAPPQRLHFDLQTGFYVYGVRQTVNQDTLLTTFAVDRGRRVPFRFLVRGDSYPVLGLVTSDVHLFGVRDSGMGAFLLGTDRQGRDLLSRILIGSQMSLTIGLLGVVLSLIIGSVLGVVSGYYGGRVDEVVQRLIEVIRSFPAIPLWMALTAALPQHWPPEHVYFAITVILSVIGWTWLARQLRGKVLALREEEFVTAARVLGASDARIIFRHLLPQVFGHIVVIATLAMPGMILAETALSFLNLGLRPPLTSWGVLLQEAQNLESLRNYPWLLLPAAFISAAVLAFNFFGDGLRDATDPHAA
jgi:peptide/nickel transport system permease protein